MSENREDRNVYVRLRLDECCRDCDAKQRLPFSTGWSDMTGGPARDEIGASIDETIVVSVDDAGAWSEDNEIIDVDDCCC